ncbi:tyrosine-type recombinase/integrase [Weissella bombi]|uniref:tyrosine-type recombinase/integrase n=1 Tax=Weissella bombi TaxID=1505725 RepID=UPI003AF27DC1
MASFYKRGKTWTASVSIKVGTSYKKKTKSGFRTRPEARAWAVTIESAKNRNGVSMHKDQLVADYFHSWYTTYKTDKAPSTINWYVACERYIRTYLPNITLKNLTRPLVQEFLNELGSRYATVTVRKAKSLLQESIKYAIYDELIFRDPVSGLVAVGKDGKSAELKFLEEPQMKAMVNYIQDIAITERNVSDEMLLLALNTGARYEELAALTWNDISQNAIDINKAWDDKGRLIKETKTKASNRVVTVPTNIIQDLFFWNTSHKSSDFVFERTELPGQPITNAAANKRLKFILNAIHSPKMITFHGIRHTHASWLLSHGVDIQYVSSRLGHQSVAMTLKVYTHMLDRTKKIEEKKSIDLLENL